MTTDIVVIDVSHWQDSWPGPDTPFEAMREAGIVGVILKATEGISYVDDTFVKRRNLCMEHGMATCSYHFLRHGDIDGQMVNFMTTVKPILGERMVLDWEDDAVTLDEVKQAIGHLLDVGLDLQVTVYASSSFLQEHVPDEFDEELARTSLWVARYSDEPPYWPKNVWPTWSLWQCTDSYSLETGDGLYGPLDGNRFNGSIGDCIVWLNPVAAVPVPPPTDESALHLIGWPADRPVVVNGQLVWPTAGI